MVPETVCLRGLDLLPYAGEGRPVRRLLDFLATSRDVHFAIGPAKSPALQSSLIVIPHRSGWPFQAHVGRARELEQLPQIMRDGKGPPWMHGRSLGFGIDRVTDPLLQRTGGRPFSWHALSEDINNLLYKIPTEEKLPLENEALTEGKLIDLLNKVKGQLRNADAVSNDLYKTALEKLCDEQHDYIIKDLLGRKLQRSKEGVSDSANINEDDVRAIVVQGLGDLSMNAWNVAYFGEEESRRRIYAPVGEPVYDRSYTCLAALKSGCCSPSSIDGGDGIMLGSELAIGRFALDRSAIRLEGAKSIDGHCLHFAVYGKAVLWNGVVVEPQHNIDEWTDVRHVFNLPDINPKGEVSSELQTYLEQMSSDHLRPEDQKRFVDLWSKPPRWIYGMAQSAAVWLFEEQLLSDPNLRRLACVGPVSFDLAALPVPEPWIEFRLHAGGYRPGRSPGALMPGQYFWSNDGGRRLHVFLKRNRYPFTMIGIGELAMSGAGEKKSRPALYAAALGGPAFAQSRLSIWDCADMLRCLGCKYALCFDEGQDVFQAFFSTGREAHDFIDDPSGKNERVYMPVVRSSDRGRLRAHLALWQQRHL